MGITPVSAVAFKRNRGAARSSISHTRVTRSNTKKIGQALNHGAFTSIEEKGRQSVTDRLKTAFDSRLIRRVVHRRGAEIHHRLRQIRSRLTPREQAVFNYICDNTLGRTKAEDEIANRQFTQGKRCRKTGAVIDFGCGLKSINTVRKARKALRDKGLIIEQANTDASGQQRGNRYAVAFLVDLPHLEEQQSRLKSVKWHTTGEYQKTPPTDIHSPSVVSKQRCRKKNGKHFMDKAHVDYLIELIQQVTGDTHSRGAFAQIALTVDEGRIMELLAILKDRGNICNRGAWFVAVARRYQKQRVIQADKPETPPPNPMDDRPIPRSTSLLNMLASRHPHFADQLDMNRRLRTAATHHKVLTRG